MKTNKNKNLISGCVFILIFTLWTVLIKTVNVKPLGQNGTNIGLATLNCWFHSLTGANLTLYNITDWLGLVPVFICMIFAILGLLQLIKRKNLFKVDSDILVLGVYYIVVIFCYLIFEMIPINYRPILINGVLEASYPSSTTLLVLGVMPTLIEQSSRRFKSKLAFKIIKWSTILFTAFMVFGRLISGVHWLTDIVGSVILCIGLYKLYKAFVEKFGGISFGI